jgi:hypothetical protein
MTNTTVYQYPAIGACLPCNQLFLVTTEVTRCLLCGAMPGLLLPFAMPRAVLFPAPEEPPPPAVEPAHRDLAYITCPCCAETLALLTTDSDVCLFSPHSPPPAEEAAPEVLPTTVAASPPDLTPPTPTMGRDFYGNPIPGQLVAPEADAPEEPLS